MAVRMHICCKYFQLHAIFFNTQTSTQKRERKRGWNTIPRKRRRRKRAECQRDGEVYIIIIHRGSHLALDSLTKEEDEDDALLRIS